MINSISTKNILKIKTTWVIVVFLYITQGMDNEEKRCAEFVRELLDLRDGLLHVDILSQNEVLELIQIACTLWS